MPKESIEVSVQESIVVPYRIKPISAQDLLVAHKLLNEVSDYDSKCQTRIEMNIDNNLGLQNNLKSEIIVQRNELPAELGHIITAIEDAKYILGLNDNWDDEGAQVVPEFIFNRAINFLKNYSKRTLVIFNTVIQAPLIQPVGDGSIDLEWETDQARLLINFKNTKDEVAFYYGEIINTSNKKFDFNGEISTDLIEDTFVSWLKNLS